MGRTRNGGDHRRKWRMRGEGVEWEWVGKDEEVDGNGIREERNWKESKKKEIQIKRPKKEKMRVGKTKGSTKGLATWHPTLMRKGHRSAPEGVCFSSPQYDFLIVRDIVLPVCCIFCCHLFYFHLTFLAIRLSPNSLRFLLYFSWWE